MATDVMTPPGVTRIGGGIGKVGLEVKALPGTNGISGKTKGISVRAKTCIPGKDQGALIVSVVEKMIVVQGPQGIQTGDRGAVSLLPVQPPEINTIFLQRMMHVIEIGPDKVQTGDIEINCLFLFGMVFCFGEVPVLKEKRSIRVNLLMGQIRFIIAFYVLLVPRCFYYVIV